MSKMLSLIFLVPTLLVGQSNSIDSLLNVLGKASMDPMEHYQTLTHLCKELYKGNSDSSRLVHNEGEVVAQIYQLDSMLGVAYGEVSSVWNYKEKEIQRAQRALTFSLVVIGLLVLSGALIIFSLTKKYKFRNDLQCAEIDTLQSYINSFFFLQRVDLDNSLHMLNKGLYRSLSEREQEILRHALSNKSNQEIADQTFVSINTVKFHLKNIYEKMGVSNRKEAMELVLQKVG